MNRTLRTSVALSALAGASACGGETPSGTTTPLPISAVAEAYLAAAMDLMEAYSINRYVIDWPPFRAFVLDRAAGAQLPSETHAALQVAVDLLDDGHSGFFPGGLPSGGGGASPSPDARYLGDGVGLMVVPSYSGDGLALAASYHDMIESVDVSGVCGWIVDVRGNTGGNMWPMLAGMGPILGEGTLGFFVDPDSIRSEWHYQAGELRLNATVMMRVADPYSTQTLEPPVAVLTDALVASSGEAVAIAFRARPNTRSFGQRTRGQTTANQTFLLSDGAVLNLTVAAMADRGGQAYRTPLVPDELVSTQYPPSRHPASDETLIAALNWLKALPLCAP